MVAVSTNLKLVKEFGIDPENAFAFWGLGRRPLLGLLGSRHAAPQPAVRL